MTIIICLDKVVLFNTGVNFIDILCADFLYECKMSSFSLVSAKYWRKMRVRARKMLMKLTPGVVNSFGLWTTLLKKWFSSEQCIFHGSQD
jgi:hypothetical protein